jgi:hypothetical protein
MIDIANVSSQMSVNMVDIIGSDRYTNGSCKSVNIINIVDLPMGILKSVDMINIVDIPMGILNLVQISIGNSMGF